MERTLWAHASHVGEQGGGGGRANSRPRKHVSICSRVLRGAPRVEMGTLRHDRCAHLCERCPACEGSEDAACASAWRKRGRAAARHAQASSSPFSPLFWGEITVVVSTVRDRSLETSLYSYRNPVLDFV